MTNNHPIAKMAAKMIVTTTVGNFVAKAMIANAPQTQKLHAAEITGAVVGVVVADKLEPTTDMIVDDLFARYEAHKLKKSVPHLK